METINGVTQITIRAPHPMVAGDYNNDGIVDAADYTVSRDHLARATLPNENPAAATPGLVDQEDYTFWKTHFGNSAHGHTTVTSSRAKYIYFVTVRRTAVTLRTLTKRYAATNPIRQCV